MVYQHRSTDLSINVLFLRVSRSYPIFRRQMVKKQARNDCIEIFVRVWQRGRKRFGKIYLRAGSLRFARPATLSVETNDLNGIVESVAALVENQAASQSVIIEKDLQKNISEISIDGEQIKQILLNLAINSLQAMTSGGRLTFRTFETKEFCAVEVEDTGGGVDDKILPKIFDPFFTTKEKGVGLGLSVAHKIAAQHKALLTATSKGGRTVFSLQFPKLLV